MKNIFTLLLLSVALYLSSCTTKDTPINVTPVLPKADSVYNGGYLQIFFNGESFTVPNLSVLNTPIYTSTCSLLSSDANDTLFIGLFQMTDHKSKSVSLNLTSYNNTSGGQVGTYIVNTNSSTLTDYSLGENRVYAISTGSIVNVTAVGDTTYGTLALNLFYNNTTYAATGTFKIPN